VEGSSILAEEEVEAMGTWPLAEVEEEAEGAMVPLPLHHSQSPSPRKNSILRKVYQSLTRTRLLRKQEHTSHQRMMCTRRMISLIPYHATHWNASKTRMIDMLEWYNREEQTWQHSEQLLATASTGAGAEVEAEVVNDRILPPFLQSNRNTCVWVSIDM
jgi:hypothetical protein